MGKLYDGSRSSYEIPVQLNRQTSDEEEEKIMQSRLKHYDHSCVWDRSKPFSCASDKQEFYTSLTQLFVDDRYKLIMCSVPKAATSNWQRVFNSLKSDGSIKPDQFTGYKVHKISTRFSDILKKSEEPLDGKLELERRINDPSYTVFINVRHPFTRLLSAWRDKFDNRKASFHYWEKKFGNYILNKFEKPEYLPAKPST